MNLLPLKKILNHRSETILGAGILTSGLTLIGSLFGVLRNALLASHFGASGSLDIYYASFRLPDLIYNVFIMGAISVVFIPIFTEYWNKDHQKAWQLTNTIIVSIGLVVGFSALLIAIFANFLLSRILVGFSSEKISVAVSLTRLMMIQPVILGISSVVSGVLRVFKMFFISALAPLIYNLGIIVGIVYLVPIFGLKGLAYGVILGALGHLFIQLPSLATTSYQANFSFKIFKETAEGMKKIFQMIGPRLLGIISYQLFLVGITAVATLLKEGSLAIFNFANDLQNLPQNVFALSFALAAFPRLSELDAQKDKAGFFEVYKDTFNQILFFLVPLAVWLIVFREPIVRLLLGYGRFNWSATLSTMEVLFILSLSMVFSGISQFLLRVFFAKKDTWRPFWASAFSYSLGLLISYHLSLTLGVKGLAVGVSITNLFNFLFLYFLLKPKLAVNLKDHFWLKTTKIIFLSLISGFLGHCSLILLSRIFPFQHVINLIFSTIISFAFSMLSFVFGALFFKIEEVYFLKKIIISKFFYGRKKRE
ncbi:MAG: murein biosynthesis integral membrane protein MurJ [Candidatus Paceibacterota bacterium]|jgi:putative peptidoglycan lipid II flippase|nr:murein biosynthesis integral membrane protein MurJ [Candidatus Paceibacterota bacterium]MDD3548509.1 murein biosynthesis integral membrane protein MurJ [Candidatus Paceibacterota bacterium]MDD4999158.1 murein biosynthesis integral membrane protein MurJ [Candidatus Paceibacterota bacterium]